MCLINIWGCLHGFFCHPKLSHKIHFNFICICTVSTVVYFLLLFGASQSFLNIFWLLLGICLNMLSINAIFLQSADIHFAHWIRFYMPSWRFLTYIPLPAGPINGNSSTWPPTLGTFFFLPTCRITEFRHFSHEDSQRVLP